MTIHQDRNIGTFTAFSEKNGILTQLLNQRQKGIVEYVEAEDEGNIGTIDEAEYLERTDSRFRLVITELDYEDIIAESTEETEVSFGPNTINRLRQRLDSNFKVPVIRYFI